MSQSPATPDNDSQIDVWNTTLGAIWTEFQAQLDRQIEPLGLEAMRVLAPCAGQQRILDIGCGCGQTSAELAARVGPPGKVVGVDVSEPMLDVARARPIAPGAVRPFFRQIDAQTGELGHHGFDAAFSRFGVMFFSNPVAAFENIHRALKPGGRMTFVCWRPFAENLWMRGPLEAALPFLPQLPTPDYTAPGPFGVWRPGEGPLDSDRRRFRIRRYPALRCAGGRLERGPDAKAPLPYRAPGLSVAGTSRLPGSGPGRCKGDHYNRYDSPNGVFMPAAVWIVQART